MDIDHLPNNNNQKESINIIVPKTHDIIPEKDEKTSEKTNYINKTRGSKSNKFPTNNRYNKSNYNNNYIPNNNNTNLELNNGYNYTKLRKKTKSNNNYSNKDNLNNSYKYYKDDPTYRKQVLRTLDNILTQLDFLLQQVQ